jgi:hypothetical protein
MVQRRLKDWLPYEYFQEFFDCPATKYLGGYIVEEHDGRINPWPGKHKNVLNWVVLECGHAVGFNENPATGWSFPVIKIKTDKFNKDAAICFLYELINAIDPMLPEPIEYFTDLPDVKKKLLQVKRLIDKQRK